MLLKFLILTFVVGALGGCCPNFSIDFFGVWVLGLEPWVLGVGFWVLGFRFEVFGFGYSLDHPKVAQITSKSIQNGPNIINSWYLGWLWAPLGLPWPRLEASWAPLGARMPKNIEKVTWRSPPRRCQRRSFLSIVRYLLGYCFWYQLSYHV